MLQRMVACALFFFIAGCSTLGAQQHCLLAKPKHAVRVATYNTFCEDGNHQNHDTIIHLIQKAKPDIMVFQECQCLNPKYFRSHLRNYRHQCFMNYRDGIKEHEDGLGIISKYPIIRRYLFPPVYGWSPGALYIVKTPQGCVQVLDAHLHPKMVSDGNIGIFAEGLWLTPRFRLQEIQYYYRFLNPNLPTIVAGDFNENDGGSAGTFLREHLFCDALMSLPRYIKTWHWDFKLFTLTSRYDRIYSSWGWRFIQCQVLHEGESDHFPVFADYYLQRVRRP